MISDGDLITIFDSSDLSFAIQCSRILKLQILMNDDKDEDKTSTQVNSADVLGIKVQLRSIRDQVNKILDCLDGDRSSLPTTKEAVTETNVPNGEEVIPAASSVNPREFDPLQLDKTTQEPVKDTTEQERTATSLGSNVVPSTAPSSHPQFVRTTPSGYQNTTTFASNPYSGGQYTYQAPNYVGQPEMGQTPAFNYPSTTMPYAAVTQYGPPQTTMYPPHSQSNPYSKSYSQASPQHVQYMPR